MLNQLDDLRYCIAAEPQENLLKRDQATAATGMAKSQNQWQWFQLTLKDVNGSTSLFRLKKWNMNLVNHKNHVGENWMKNLKFQARKHG